MCGTVHLQPRPRALKRNAREEVANAVIFRSVSDLSARGFRPPKHAERMQSAVSTERPWYEAGVFVIFRNNSPEINLQLSYRRLKRAYYRNGAIII